MQDEEVKKTINKQIIWVFFLPLVMAICHILAAGKMMANMISAFGLYDLTLTLLCIAVICVLFAVVYFVVYGQTARVYYRIVKW